MTTEKAQGMTLRRACISVNQRGGQPGNLFTALSRVCHVDDLMLDDFPSMQTIMKQKESINFHKRQIFERNMRVLFSKTLRRHLRDETLYNSQMVWTENESEVATSIFRFLHEQPDLDDDEVPEIFLKKHPSVTSNTFTTVWARLHKWPHMFELAYARGTLNTLDLQGNVIPAHCQVPSFSKVTITGYHVALPEWLAYVTNGTLSLPVFEMFAKHCRGNLQQYGLLHSAFALSTAKPTTKKGSPKIATRPLWKTERSCVSISFEILSLGTLSSHSR